MTLEPLVSVITPVYNEERYLAECIESVLAQSYQNWIYTIVDNCSTDGTAEIARCYAAKDPRIRVFQNREFLNVIANHNAALRQISPDSKYCKVVLGDDRIYPDCLERMVALAEANPSVGIVGAYALEGQRIAWTGLSFGESLVSGREVCRRHLLDGVYVFGSANAVLYRADLVRGRDPFYPEGNIHADTEVCFALLKGCDFGFVHKILTVTRVRPQSLSTASKRMHTDYGGLLRLIAIHGPAYLTREEYDSRLSAHLSGYYRFLGKCIVLRDDPEFWDYHKAQIVKAGMKFSHSRLTKGVLESLGLAALHPYYSVRRFMELRRELSLNGSSHATAAREL